jgi:hypothetical protein
MFVKGILRNCDMCDEKQVAGFHFFARGASGRVCNVLDVCHECDHDSHDTKGYTLEEVEAWAESEPGGYLDY